MELRPALSWRKEHATRNVERTFPRPLWLPRVSSTGEHHVPYFSLEKVVTGNKLRARNLIIGQAVESGGRLSPKREQSDYTANEYS
jgi:hypothetical protein